MYVCTLDDVSYCWLLGVIYIKFPTVSVKNL